MKAGDRYVIAFIVVLSLLMLWRVCVQFVAFSRISRLIAQLDTCDEEARAKAATQLSRMGELAIYPLIRSLGQEQSGEGAVLALGKIGAPAVEPLNAALKDGNADVRSNAALALGRIKDKRATLSLIAALRGADKNGLVRLYSAQALGDIRDTRAVGPLVMMLQDRNELYYPRYCAAQALGKIGDARAIKPLTTVLADKSDSAGRDAAAHALHYFKRQSSIDALIAALPDEDHEVESGMQFSLRHLGHSAVTGLVAALETRAVAKRRAVAAALASCELYQSDPQARTALLQALCHKDWAVAAGGWEFYIRLGKLGSESVLIKGLQRCGSHELAMAFYSSGNRRLRMAAAEWAKTNGDVLDECDAPKWGVQRTR